jgi:hypothetical protein
MKNQASIENKNIEKKHLFCKYDVKEKNKNRKNENECLLGRKIVKNKN